MYRFAYNILNGGYNNNYYNYNYNNQQSPQNQNNKKEGTNFYVMIFCLLCCSILYSLAIYGIKNEIDTDCDLRKTIKGNPCRECVLNEGYSFKKPPPSKSNKKYFKKAPDEIDTEEKCKKWCEDDKDIFGCSYFVGDKSKLDATKGSSQFFADKKTKCVGMTSSKKYLNSASQEPFVHEIEVDQDVKSGLCKKNYLEFHNTCTFVGGFTCSDSKDTLVSNPSLLSNLLIEKNKKIYEKERKEMPNDLSNKKYGDMEIIDVLDSKKCKDICQTHDAKNCLYKESEDVKHCYWGYKCPYLIPTNNDIKILAEHPLGFFLTNKKPEKKSKPKKDELIADKKAELTLKKRFSNNILDPGYLRGAKDYKDNKKSFEKADLIDKFSLWGSSCDGKNMITKTKIKLPTNINKSPFYMPGEEIEIDQSKMNIENIYYK